MQIQLQTLNNKAWQFFSSKKFEFVFKLILMTTLMLICQHVFADEDPLAGTEGSLTATLGSGGTGRKFLYLVEGVVSVAAYIKTKNLLMFGGVVGIAIFLNILFKVAGIT
jgi:hypothetical protein